MCHAADSLATHLLNKENKEFCKEVKQIQGNCPNTSAATVRGVSGAEAICEIWEKHYLALLNSSSDCSKQKEIYGL